MGLHGPDQHAAGAGQRHVCVSRLRLRSTDGCARSRRPAAGDRSRHQNADVRERQRHQAVRHHRYAGTGRSGVRSGLRQLRVGADAANQDDSLRRVDDHGARRRRVDRNRRLQSLPLRHRGDLSRLQQHQRCCRVQDPRHDHADERSPHDLVGGDRRSRVDRRDRQPILHGVEWLRRVDSGAVDRERGRPNRGARFSRRQRPPTDTSLLARDRTSLVGRRGWDLSAPLRTFEPDAEGASSSAARK